MAGAHERGAALSSSSAAGWSLTAGSLERGPEDHERGRRRGLVAFFASMGWIGDLPDAERLPLVVELRSLLDAAEYGRRWETHVHWTRLAAPGRDG